MKRRKKQSYFEQWYFREQAADCTCTFTIRINYDEEGQMQGILDVELPDGNRRLCYAHPVNMNLKESLFLVLEKNVFTESCIHLDIDEPGLSIKGDIYVEREYGQCRRIGIKRKIWALEQELSGVLLVNGREISFAGGKGYLEERCGLTSVLAADSLYTQCNWFGGRPFRIVCGSTNQSCFAVIDQDGYPIRFAAWKGAKLEYASKDGFRMRQRKYILEGWRAEGNGATVRYRLTHKGDVLFDEISRRAVYECMDIRKTE